jgi:arylsulfatase A-like enzyme
MVSPKQPNVIVFFTDQQRHDTTGVHGCELGLTPNFDRMAQEGTHVAKSFTCQPVCAPARACLQTGKYATQHGVWRNGYEPHRDLPTLANYFNDAGYHTGYIGKWHLASTEHHGAVPRELQGGYQSWLGANLLEFVSDAFDTHLWDQDGVEHQLPGYRVDAVTDAAIRHIHKRSETKQPFFLFVSHLEPHHQNSRDDYPAPRGYEKNYSTAKIPPDLRIENSTAVQHWPGYCGMVKRLDESFGRMLDAVESLGLTDDTIILFTSDHGNHFKTRNQEYKRSCHDASIRVPTALSGPGFEGGGRINKLVSLIDLPPTLLDAAGIAVPERMEGQSIIPLLQQPGSPWPEEVFVQISESQTGRAVRTERWKYAVKCPDLDNDGNPVSLPAAENYVDECLYDLKADPWEITNLVGYTSHADVVRVMRERLARRMVEIGEVSPVFIDAPEAAPYEHTLKPEESYA